MNRYNIDSGLVRTSFRACRVLVIGAAHDREVRVFSINAVINPSQN